MCHGLSDHHSRNSRRDHPSVGHRDTRHQAQALPGTQTEDPIGLERSILRYEQDYFDYIGHEHPDAITFKILVETKDIKGIQEHWRRLSTSFVRLETRAGWRGRPLIMDYYYTYEDTLAALAKLGR